MAATRLPATDAVLLGVGLVGSIVGRELLRAGLNVVGLERGEPRFTVPDFQGPAMHDELRYSIRKGLMQDNTRETVTFRNNDSQVALPQRRWESFLPGTGLGGAAVHWNGQTEGPRSRPYPTPPQKEPYGAAIFRKAATGFGYSPFTQPSCNLSELYTNPEGLKMSTCMCCGFCER